VLHCPVQSFEVVLTLSHDYSLIIKSYTLANVSSGNRVNFVEQWGFLAEDVEIHGFVQVFNQIITILSTPTCLN
jgi:hypothetical protein